MSVTVILMNRLYPTHRRLRENKYFLAAQIKKPLAENQRLFPFISPS
jgi:hypothetical protein